MNVFLSWSGSKSQAVAEEFNTWLQCVLQSVKPWISTSGIEGGSLWFDEISSQLSDSGVGIIFLTEDNKNNPWILFEAGALAKGLKLNRVCTFLIDLEPQDIHNPLSNFNHTFTNKDSIYKLVATLNSRLDKDHSLSIDVLTKVFEKYWPDLDSKIQEIKEKNPSIETPKSRDREEKIDEILLITRSMVNRINKLESESFNNRALLLEKAFQSTLEALDNRNNYKINLQKKSDLNKSSISHGTILGGDVDLKKDSMGQTLPSG